MSEESAYLGMFLRVFDDLCDISPEYSPREATADRLTCVNRYRAEGLAFFTKTLPALAKALEASLETGTFVPLAAFKRARGRANPQFLGALLKEIVDEKGVLLDNPSASCIGLVRQVCYFWYKFDADYPAHLVDEVIDNFVTTDASLTHCEEIGRQQRLLLTIASSFLFRVFRDFDPADIRPRPGPGASASGTHKSQRYEPLVHYRVIHEKYPYYRYFYMGSDHLLDRASAYRALPRKENATSVLRTVPKDSRGPRIICMEEQEMMFLQQGLGDAMREHVMHHPLTRGHVNFKDQEVNRRLAQESSLTREYATLDMKEASDRISRKLVELLFCKLPELRDCLLALSTRQIKLPSGKVLGTKKFAPMGSSLCFPIMSVVHYALAVAAVHAATARATKALAKEIYVYGDDIIVKTVHVKPLFEAFPLFGLRFNEEKSFRRGYFRESCGMDAFQGVDVSPQRLKRRFFDGRDPRDILAVQDMHKALYDRGFVRVAAMLRTLVDSRYGKFPIVGEGSPFLGWRHCLPHAELHHAWRVDRSDSSEFWTRISAEEASAAFKELSPVWDPNLHGWTISARVMKTVPDAMMLGGWEQLMRSNLDALRSSARLDGRWKRQFISFQRQPLHALYGGASQFLPTCR
jgi:hypothetical protein